MQASLLSANTHFNAMMTRVAPVEDIRTYPEYDRHNPGPTWSLPETIATKIPTQSDDRDDYSSDSERAEEESSSADFSGAESGKGCEGITTTAVITTEPLLSSTVSFEEHLVVVTAEAANAEASMGFQSQNDEDEGDGLKTLEDGLQKMSLTKSDSVPLRNARGPNGGRATKPGTLTENHIPGYQRQEPIESWDGGYHEDQPKKFYRPNEEAISNNNNNGGYDCYSLPVVYGTTPIPRMQNQPQHPCYDPPTGYSFPCQFGGGNEQYFGTYQGVAPTYQPQSSPYTQPIWVSGNHFSSVGNQSEIQQLMQSKSNFPCDNVPTTFFQYPSSDIDNGNYRTSLPDRPNNRLQYIAGRPSMPGHQHKLVSNKQTVPRVSLDQVPILISDTPSGAPPISTPSPEPVTASSSSASDLDIVFEWLGEQAEIRSQPQSLQACIPSMTDQRTSSSQAQCLAPWNKLTPPSVTLSLGEASSYSNYLPVSSSPRQCLPPCNESADALSLAASYSDSHFDKTAYISGTDTASLYYRIPSNSTASLTTTSSSSNLCPSPTSFLSDASPPNVRFLTVASPSTVCNSVSFSMIDDSPVPGVPAVDAAADAKAIHSSLSSDSLTTTTYVLSDHGSVACSPTSTVFESDVTNPSGDEQADGDTMAQIAEADAVAESFQILALISQDSLGDTPLHVAMIDDKWYLAESILKRLIKEDLLNQVINVRNKLQQTPLCLAVICNKPQIVETLIEHGADVNVHIKASDDYLGPKFCQPLHLASSRGHLWKQTLRKLLKADNIDLDVFNSDGKSALHCAIEGHGRQFKDVRIDCKDTLRVLAERGANLNQPDCGHEKTPLHYAIERRDVELVSRLLVLANTCSPDLDRSSVANMLEARTGNGNTALHLAASVEMNTVDHKKLIQQLMSKGADPSSKNSDGFLPRELTKNRQIVELLKGRTASGRSPNADKKRTS